MTPVRVARFMASLFPPTTLQTCSLLDAGAGVGALSSAFLDRVATSGELNFQNVEVEAYEIDNALRGNLDTALATYSGRLPITYRVSSGDFIWEAACKRFQGSKPFSHAILNPPYKKINSASKHRFILRRAGIETVNLYSAFVALALMLMQPGGQLVAILPRSFCNGPYYRPFRQILLHHAALRHLHLFASRSKAFKDDAVLQENVIIRLERDGTQGEVTVRIRQTIALAISRRTYISLIGLSFPMIQSNSFTCRLRISAI
jgi:adenine-specific DNA-methyltransferase